MRRDRVVLLAGMLLVCAGWIPESSGCVDGWFGSKCQYKCHCVNNSCDNNGDCTNSAICEFGWFGPACQFVDLVNVGKITTSPPSYVTPKDGQDLCSGNSPKETVIIDWGTSYIMTWLRVGVADGGSTNKIKVQFTEDVGKELLDCTDQSSSPVTATVVDIHCKIDVAVKRVIVTGDGNSSICYLRISGGQKFTLKQKTAELSSINGITISNDTSTGNTNCIVAQIPTKTEYWNIKFSQPVIVSRIIVTDKADRIDGESFELATFDETSSNVFFFRSNPLNGKVYNIVTQAREPVIQVDIKADYNVSSTEFPFCDVEIFAEMYCTAGKYGRECEHTCNCNSKDCFGGTGGCPAGCKPGFIGESCYTACPDGQFGDMCNGRCSKNCAGRGLCSPTNGTCTEGCKNGSIGLLCHDACPAGLYGGNCNNNCSKNCAGSGLCSLFSGTCSEGCKDGYTGLMCNTSCVKSYGHNCELDCSKNCKVDDSADPGICHHITGACFLGCQNGYHGVVCNEKSIYGISELAFAVIITVVVAVVIIAIVIIIACCYIKRSRSKMTMELEHYDSATDGRPDLHTYQSMKKPVYINDVPKDTELFIVIPQVAESVDSQDNKVYVNKDNNFYEPLSEDTSVDQKQLPDASSEKGLYEEPDSCDGPNDTEYDLAMNEKNYMNMKL